MQACTDRQEENYFIIQNPRGPDQKITEGNTLKVSVVNDLGNQIFEKSFDELEELKSFVSSKLLSRPEQSPFNALLVTPRSESWASMAQNILCPTFTNVSRVQRESYAKISAITAALALDSFTLLPRLAIGQLATIFNSTPVQPHPFVDLCSDNAVAMGSLKGGQLVVNIKIKKVEIKEGEKVGEEWRNFEALEKTSIVSFPILLNPNVPSSIFEHFQVEEEINEHRGTKNDIDGHTFIASYSSTSVAREQLSFNFLSRSEQSSSLSTLLEEIYGS